MSNSKIANKPKFSIAITTPKFQETIHNTLGDFGREKQFVASLTSAVANNPALQECDAASILAGALLGESLGLSPSPQLGQYYLVPYDVTEKGKDGRALKDSNGNIIKTKKAQFVMGYIGYNQLALRSGEYRLLNAIPIKEGEFVSLNPLSEALECAWITDIEKREKAKTIGFAATYELLNGGRKLIYWTKEKVTAHADKYSPAFSAAVYKKMQNGEIPDNEMWKYSSNWYKDFDAMGVKTVLKQLLKKWGIVSSKNLITAFESDEKFVTIGKNGEITEDNKAEMLPNLEENSEGSGETVKKVSMPEKIELTSV